MLCDTAIELLRDLQRDSILPPYDARAIKTVEKEIMELHTSILKKLEDMPDAEEDREVHDVMQLMSMYVCMNRNKRCILAYLKHRVDEIINIRWESGTSVLPEELSERLSQQEKAFADKYDQILCDYMSDIGEDITMDLAPPRSTMITVRCREDYGDFVTEDGVVPLTRNSEHRLRRNDIQQLVRQGVVVHK